MEIPAPRRNSVQVRRWWPAASFGQLWCLFGNYPLGRIKGKQTRGSKRCSEAISQTAFALPSPSC